MDPAGQVTPFARGPGGYHEDKGAEAYLANSPGGTVSAAGCSFARDETFVLRLHVPIGVNRVSASGDESGSFANLQGVTTLNGIAFDTSGAFDDRLLVTGPARGKTVIFAIDCNGAVTIITRSAPRLVAGPGQAPRADDVGERVRLPRPPPRLRGCRKKRTAKAPRTPRRAKKKI